MDRVVFSRFLLYFEEIARQGSVRQAAERLNVSASAVDKQLIRAEEQLGVSLFERLPRGMRLTSAGELLVGRVRGWQKDLGAFRRELSELQGINRGEIRMAVAQEAVFGFLPAALAHFMRSHPRIAAQVTVTQSDQIRQLVIAGGADFGLTFAPQPMPGVEVIADATFVLCAVLPAEDRFARRSSLPLEIFFERPVIIPDTSTHLRDVLDIAAARSKVRLAPLLTTNSLELMRSMVAEGLGFGMICLREGDPLPQSGGLVTLPFPKSTMPKMTLSLIAASDRQQGMVALLARRTFTNFMTGQITAGAD